MRQGHIVFVALLVGSSRSSILPDTTTDAPSTIESAAINETLQSLPIGSQSDLGPLEDRSQLELRRMDVTQSLDYRCGDKWGKCPSGTCCSSAGK